MDLARLKRETAPDHQLTEDAVPLMQPDLKPATYGAILVGLYGFIRGWELWADTADDPQFQALLSRRRRSALLAQDLEHFAIELPITLYAGPDLDRTARPSLLGAMYVIEGSTLGGQYIARHVEKVLALEPGHGDAYFRGYGDQTGALWTEFKQVLTGVDEKDSEMLIAAAKKLFTDFRLWMNR